MPVLDQTTTQSYTGNGVATVFAYSFKLLDEADVLVTIDGVTKTLSTDYTVSGVGNSGGGNITFVTAPANDASVVIARNMAYSREVDYQENGDLTAATLDDDIDRVVMLIQQINGSRLRSLRVPVADVSIAELPAAAARANLYLAFDANGDPVVVSGTSSDLIVSAFIETLLDDADAAAARATLGLNSASQAEMEAGTEAGLRAMSPLRVAQAIAALSSATQIQPISASVGSNALTISASSLSLDFRSATLGSGAVTRVTGTPANLVISSGSTLGTVSGQQSRIAVLALNNAGTIELAAVNISGGNDLTETGLISTTAEGGAGAADSATVIYSTTARTNVAYRVIGYIESTQATAGTWATAPSTIQGVGGQALAAMSSLGYGQTYQNVTGSRSASTTYYNTTGKAIWVCVVSGMSTSNQYNLTINGAVVDNDLAVSGSAVNVSVQGIVPPGGSYSVAISGAAISTWYELR